jgi:(R,R)-butanediol dehydrogenase/meso-butanediol dehydrogenase/diacetyl reductase
MRAAVLREIGKPLEIQTVEDPTPGPGEMVLRVRGSGICGSDLHWAQLGLGVSPGQILGHEFSGEVVEVGRDVGGRFSVGDRICSIPFIGCGRCRACLCGDVTACDAAVATGLQAPGAFAEYVRVGAAEALRLPEGVTHRQGALVEPLAVGLHAVSRAAPPPGARVLLIGGGPIGLAATLWSRFFGASAVVVSERSAARRELSGRFGATDAIDPTAEEVLPTFEARAGGPPDLIYECVGVPGLLQECLGMAPRRSRVVVVGVCMEPDTILPFVAMAKEVTMQFVIAYERRDFELAIAMLEQKRIASDEMITDVVGLDDFCQAFESLKRPGRQCKVMLEP